MNEQMTSMNASNDARTQATTRPAPTIGDYLQLSALAYQVSRANEQTLIDNSMNPSALINFPPTSDGPLPVEIKVPPGFTLLKMSDISQLAVGFAAAAFQDANGNIIAFEGTVPGLLSAYSQGTLSADISLAQGVNSPALDEARSFAKMIQRDYANGEKIYVTGHSLGGAEAQAACEELGTDKCAGGATFAAPGILMSATNQVINSELDNYIKYGDPIPNY